METSPINKKVLLSMASSDHCRWVSTPEVASHLSEGNIHLTAADEETYYVLLRDVEVHTANQNGFHFALGFLN